MKRTEFRDELRKYIRCAFDNEQRFLDKFMQQGIELREVYMASGSVRVSALVEHHHQGDMTYIDTDDYLDWCDEILADKPEFTRDKGTGEKRYNPAPVSETGLMLKKLVNPE